MDGTIFDSELLYHQIIRRICETYKKHYSKALEAQLYGRTDHDICTGVVTALKLPISAEELETKIKITSKTEIPHVQLQEGAERLITHLYDSKILIALATNSKRETVQLHEMTRPNLFSMFHHKVCADDPEIRKGKPDPALFLVAAQRFPHKPRPKDCLVFEDSVAGVEAARSAGMQVVMVPGIHLKPEFTRRPTLVLQSLKDFKPEMFGLPPFYD